MWADISFGKSVYTVCVYRLRLMPNHKGSLSRHSLIKGIQLVGARSALPVASVFIGEVSLALSDIIQ